jgi:hypothetical protein
VRPSADRARGDLDDVNVRDGDARAADARSVCLEKVLELAPEG